MNFDFLKDIDDEIFVSECKDLYDLCCASELTVYSQPTASLGSCRAACERIMRFYYAKNDGHNSKVAEKIGKMQKSANVVDAFQAAIHEELQKKEDIINEREKKNKERIPKTEEEIENESFKQYAVLDNRISSIRDSGNDALHTGKIENVELLARENLKSLFIVISSILKYCNLISENDIPQYIEPLNDTINRDLDLKIEVPDEYNFENAIAQDMGNGETKLSFSDSDKYYIGKVKNNKPYGKGLFYFSDKSVYEGEWKNGLPNGHGKRTYDDGKIYDGDWEDGKRHGKGIYSTFRGNDGKRAIVVSNWKDDGMDDESGEIIFEDGKKYIGGLKGTLQNGKGCFYREDGSIYIETQFISGVAFGFTKFYFANGQIGVKGNLKEGKWDGPRTDFYENGNIKFEGYYKEGKICGIGKKYFENGNLMEEGQYENNQLNGDGKTYYKDGGLEYEGVFKNGNRNGFGKKYNKEGVIIYEGYYIEGKSNGESKSYHDDGTLWHEGTRLNGRFDGLGKEYNKDGKLIYEGDFKEGNREGDGKEYYESGQLKYEGEFKRNRYNGLGKYFRENGKLWCEGKWKEGKMDGEGRLFYEKGSLFYEGEFKNGKLSGFGKCYWDNGQLQYEGEHSFGKHNGFGKYYNAKGQLQYEGKYENGFSSGQGVIVCSDGRREGTFKFGELNGYVKYLNNNNDSYDEYWVNGTKLKYDEILTLDIEDEYFKVFKVEALLKEIRKKKYAFTTKEKAIQACEILNELIKTNQAKDYLVKRELIIISLLSICAHNYLDEAIRSGDISLNGISHQVTNAMKELVKYVESVKNSKSFDGNELDLTGNEVSLPNKTKKIIDDVELTALVSVDGMNWKKTIEVQSGKIVTIRARLENMGDKALSNVIFKVIHDEGVRLRYNTSMVYDGGHIKGMEIPDIIDLSGFNTHDQSAGSLTQLTFQMYIDKAIFGNKTKIGIIVKFNLSDELSDYVEIKVKE